MQQNRVYLTVFCYYTPVLSSKIAPNRNVFKTVIIYLAFKFSFNHQQGQAWYLGRTQTRHPETTEQQGIQQKDSAGLEEGFSRPAFFLYVFLVDFFPLLH